jgi:hypothetical protein
MTYGTNILVDKKGMGSGEGLARENSGTIKVGYLTTKHQADIQVQSYGRHGPTAPGRLSFPPHPTGGPRAYTPLPAARASSPAAAKGDSLAYHLGQLAPNRPKAGYGGFQAKPVSGAAARSQAAGVLHYESTSARAQRQMLQGAERLQLKQQCMKQE